MRNAEIDCPDERVDRALALAGEGKAEAALDVLAAVLARKPDYPPALLYRGRLLEQVGRRHEAVQAWHAALERAREQALWTRADRIPPALGPVLAQAALGVATAREAFVEERLLPVRRQFGDAALARVDRCLAMLNGKRRVEYLHPSQRPTFMLFPGIPAHGFFDRRLFPFLDRIEAASADIQAELASVLTQDAGVQPFINMPPANAGPWKTLNHSPDWNAFFFYRDGNRYDANCRRCPKTAAALDSIELARVPGHSPEAFFSILTPGTHIPPHTGVTNTRLTCHLPLIIPENCALRVGGEVHHWTQGHCVVFDDTFEHEAWNGSDRTRVVLIFDLWNVYLSQAEREAMAVIVPAIGQFNREMGP
jgi:aspartate beta-hydroxylase